MHSRLTSRRFLSVASQALGGLSSWYFAREEGQTLAEYVMILALVTVVVIAGLLVARGTIEGLYTKVESVL